VLPMLRSLGVRSLLVEGGGRVITSMLAAGVVDRLVASISPTIIGTGIDTVGPLGVGKIADGVRLDRRRVYLAGDDILLGFDVTPLQGVESGCGPSTRIGDPS
jgi:riboflavin biosynthesis pyrimidine reductase